jgi:protein-disulfide isomerase
MISVEHVTKTYGHFTAVDDVSFPARQGRFKAFHDRMFALGRPTAATIAEAQRAAGIQAELVEKVKSSGAGQVELRRNYELARALSATGTPTFVVGDEILQGAVGYDRLKAAIATARGK